MNNNECAIIKKYLHYTAHQHNNNHTYRVLVEENKQFCVTKSLAREYLFVSFHDGKYKNYCGIGISLYNENTGSS